jgi:hypothetical protein
MYGSNRPFAAGRVARNIHEEFKEKELEQQPHAKHSNRTGNELLYTRSAALHVYGTVHVLDSCFFFTVAATVHVLTGTKSKTH